MVGERSGENLALRAILYEKPQHEGYRWWLWDGNYRKEQVENSPMASLVYSGCHTYINIKCTKDLRRYAQKHIPHYLAWTLHETLQNNRPHTSMQNVRREPAMFVVIDLYGTTVAPVIEKQARWFK